MSGFTSAMTLLLKSLVCVPPNSLRRRQKLRIVHEHLNEVGGPPQKCELKDFIVKTIVMAEGKCVPLLVSYCLDIVDCRDMSRVQHGVAEKLLSFRYMVTGKDVISTQIAYVKLLRDTKMVR